MIMKLKNQATIRLQAGWQLNIYMLKDTCDCLITSEKLYESIIKNIIYLNQVRFLTYFNCCILIKKSY